VQAGPNAPPAPAAWEEFLDAPPAHDPASIQSLLDNLSVIANYQGATLSSAVALLACPYGLPARITTNLGAIPTTAALVLGAKVPSQSGRRAPPVPARGLRRSSSSSCRR